jgi:hypothetical protein
MDGQERTHRLFEDRALCGERRGVASTTDASVTCPACLALLALAARRRRSVVRRAMVVIGKLGSA